MIDAERLKILTESAKYDVSCSSSGSARANRKGGIGNAAPAGICHSFTPDGRCISLLKILLSNKCAYNCLYCPNRAEADVPRASATPDEICELTIAFYKRNYIEGLFLSSAVDGSPDSTMERMLETVIKLRKVYNFNGYIHLKGIPKADRLLTFRAAQYVDRMSYNVELPSEHSLKLLAPQKSKESVLLPMRELAAGKRALAEEKSKKKPRFLPAGQTTQMIVGASPEADGQILRLSQAMYRKFSLKRVYFSAYIPVVKHSLLPDKTAGLLREHRLYQADWLMRFYGFSAEEIAGEGDNLPEEYDPKCAWALRHMELFPVEINRAPLEMLLRVPGIGTLGAYKIVRARKFAALGFDDLAKMRIVLKRAKHFITCGGKFYGADNAATVKALLALEARGERYEQLSLFSGEGAVLPMPDARENSEVRSGTEKRGTEARAQERFALLSTAANAESARTGQL